MSKAPICDNCGVQMVERTRRSDGRKFYGCPNWPNCDETAEHEDEDSMTFGDFYNGKQD